MTFDFCGIAWTNALLRMDLTAFSTSSPPLEVVNADRNASNAPPRVAFGGLWSNEDGRSLYQTYGQFSDTPPETPSGNQLWKYDIPNNSWAAVQTSGVHPEGVAQGAQALVSDPTPNGQPTVYYFGGFLDR